MATNVLEPLPIPADLAGGRTAPQTPAGGARAAAAVLSPVVAALAALALHEFLPNRQLPPLSMGWLDDIPAWGRPYPAVLESLLAVSVLLAAAQSVGRPLRPWVRHHAPLLAGALGLFTLWDLITLKLNWMELPYFPGPGAVFAGMFEDRQLLFESTRHSLLLLLTGYGVGVAAGLVSGVLIGWFRRVRYWGMPLLKLVGPIPATALVALVMTLFSRVFASAFPSAAALIGYAVWFPVTMLTASGIANVRVSYLDVARTLGAGRLYLICRVAVPAALPTIFIGMFIGLTASFLTLIVAESVGVQSGLGYYLQWRLSNMEYDKGIASLLIMAGFFSGLMTLLFKVRDWILKWQEGVIKW